MATYSADALDQTPPCSPGRFTRVSVQTPAGEIEARLSDRGNWELRVRRDDETSWRLACHGDVESGAACVAPPVLEVDSLVRGPLTIIPESQRALVNGIDVRLTKKEFVLLLALASQPHRVFSKADLSEALWGDPTVQPSRIVDCHASRLRCALRKAGVDAVVNCWGVGYRYWDRTDLAVLS